MKLNPIEETLNIQKNNEELHFVINHVVHGEIKKGKCLGIHFFQTERHRVVELLQLPNNHGIWEAKIEVLNNKTNAWVLKKKASTFFPSNWNLPMLTIKFEEALKNRKRITAYKSIGTTHCGVQIVFIYKEGKIVCCFPIYE